ncbi:GNAT family N-acetyltransferase [Aquihabitans daechungensis]|uniref:GNAT family N-acetyltransferase n=1 Tax=Aquihabitans daechungensis TaxID=1052257 RepID=UPI003BA077C1
MTVERLEAVVADLATIRTGWVRIRPNPLHADRWEQVLASAPAGTFGVPKRSHVLELDADPDRLFAEQFTSSARRNVRLAQRAGIEVEVDDEGRLVPVFHDLLMRSVERWAGAAHEPLAVARYRAGRRDPVEKFQAWSEAMRGGCRVLVARRDGVPIAASIVLQGANAHLTRGAMDRELVGRDRPNELLMWHAIRDASLAGCRWFHLGESGTSASLAAYKERFGAVGIDYPEVRLERVPMTALDRTVRRAGKRVLGVRSPS